MQDQQPDERETVTALVVVAVLVAPFSLGDFLRGWRISMKPGRREDVFDYVAAGAFSLH